MAKTELAEGGGWTVLRSHPDGVVAEQYRVLAQRLEPLAMAGARRIGFTSASAGEGRTCTAVNAALALARGGRNRVALVDAHLRRPAVHAAFGLRQGPGLAEVIDGDFPIEEALIPLPDGVHALPAGHSASPSATIASPRLAHVLAWLAERFGLVLVDAPPVLPLADVPTLAQALDGLVLVLRAARTRREVAAMALDALPAARVLGCVLHGVASESGTTWRLLAAHARAARARARG